MNEKLDTKCHYPLEKGTYYIYDDNENDKPLFLKENENWNLRVINNSKTDVNFFQNDNCLMKDNTMKKCDWICIFKNKFYFIEAKDVKKKQRSKARKNADEKFEITIPYFINLYPEIQTMDKYVILNFKSNSNITRAADKAKQSYYSEIFNAKYKETNELKF